MKKKLFLRLCLMMIALLLFHSCRQDDLTAASDTKAETQNNLSAKRGGSKSLWQEDEVYITKVKEVYDQYSDESYIQNHYGIILWDYAMTMNTFDEKYLVAPVLRDNRVVRILEVFRKDDEVFFKFSDKDTDTNAFFQTLIFEREKISLPEGKLSAKTNQSAKTSTLQCRDYILIVGYVEGASGEQYPITKTKTVCKFVEEPDYLTDCLGVMDIVTGECITGSVGGSGNEGGGGYPYPQEEDPCAKIKANFKNPQFKQQFTNLNKPEIYNGINEEGVFERSSLPGSGTAPSFTSFSGQSCTTFMMLPDNTDGVTGLFHVHNNINCDNGGINVKAPSPGDLYNFFHVLMKQANIYKGSYKEGYSVIMTDWGSYMLKYNGTSWPTNVTNNDFTKWDLWFKREYQKLEYDQKMDAVNVERVFAQFLKEAVNVDGLEVYKVTENTAAKLDYDPATKKAVKTPCPTPTI